MESSTKSHLHLRRVSQWLSRWRKFRVLLDGEQLTSIKNGEEQAFEIAPGLHELVVAIDWVSSEPVVFRCEAGEHVRFVCGHPSPTWRAALSPSLLVSSIHLVRDEPDPSGEITA